MAINFPASPSTNDTHTENAITWIFNGTSWDAQGVPVTAASIGLGSVDNTADADKPVSTAQQAAIDALTPIPKTTQGVDFNGSSQYGRADNFHMSMESDDFTIEMWVKDGTAYNGNDKLLAYDKDGAGIPVFQIKKGNTSGTGKKLILQTHSGGYMTAYTDEDVFTHTNLMHLKMVVLAGAVTFYVDGEAVASSGSVHSSLDFSSTNDYLYLARRSGGSADYFDLKIYTCRVYVNDLMDEVNYDFSQRFDNTVLDSSGNQRHMSLYNSPSDTLAHYGAFTIGSVAGTFNPSTNIDTLQGAYCDGTHVWLCGSQKIAKFTVGGVLVESVTNSPDLTSWGGVHIYNGVLYAVRFSRTETNKIYSFDPDDLAAGETEVKELTGITDLGCNGIHRLSDGTWLLGMTNGGDIDTSKQNKIFVLDSSFNLTSTLVIPIVEQTGLQGIVSTTRGLYISGHDLDNVGPTILYRIRIDGTSVTLEDSQTFSDRIGGIAYDPAADELILVNRGGTQAVEFRTIDAENASAPNPNT